MSKQAGRYTMDGQMVEQYGNSRVILAGHKMPDGSTYIYSQQYQIKENGVWRASLVPGSTKRKLREKVAAALDFAS